MILLLVVIILVSLLFSAWFGAPYVPILNPQIGPILDALNLKPGQTLIDLGCGDGKVLKAAAKRGIKGIGYEINPWLVLVAKINCFQYRRLVKIKLANYWRVKLPQADAIFTFLITGFMPKLDKLLKQQVKKPTKVVSYVYAIPGVKPKHTATNFFVYEYP